MNMEIALDFAVQCSPDHPWLKQHPEWFKRRPDGSIRYAENPPKKYEDIVNPDFYCADRIALWPALRDVVLFWVQQGVRIFRVDNPHTKPFPFWEWLIREVQERDPNVLFLSEAFTRPKVMKALAKLGFTQSYTYFTWRTHKAELQAYLSEITRYPEREYFRPNFFVNTPDILPVHLQNGEPWMFKSRVALAATLSANYGIYNGFELLEHEPIPGREEYLNSEKYEIKVRDWNKPGNIKDYIGRLNRLRRENPALLQTSNLRFAQVDDGEVIGFVKESVARDNAVAVAIALSGHGPAHVLVPLRRNRHRPRRRARSLCAPSTIWSPASGTSSNGAACGCPSIRRTIPPCCSAVKVEDCAVNVLPHIDVQPKAGNDLWYKDAIIYQLHVKAFADSNSDGIGDFAGLTEKLDYLQDLGVTALWLLPFYPSPGKDDGYDIADYRRINPDFGTMRDFRRFMTEAQRRDLRVITELVINHTSDQHPWFKRARRSQPGTDARNWYVWSDTDQKYAGTRIIFTDTEKSNWTWDPDAKALLLAPLLLAPARPQLRQPARAVGAGPGDAPLARHGRRRLPARRHSLSVRARGHQQREPAGDARRSSRRSARELDAYSPGKVLLAEANQWPEDVSAYFGDGDECHMAYHFPLMPRIYMAIAQEDRFPIADILRQTPDIPANCQWALFLRNHDELTLEMVTDVERDYLWSTYATDPRARINLGIRRRLASLMDNDRRKIELMNSLLFSLPGTPIIYYGDEIGMGDNIYLGDRNGVRTPMQWTSDRNGGFSRCDPARLYLPVIMDPVYGYQAVNVEAQPRSPSSLLNWTKRLIGVRRSSKAFGRGTLSFVRPANRTVLVYVRQYENEIIAVRRQPVALGAGRRDRSRPWKGRVPLEMLGRTAFPRIGERPYRRHAGALRLLLVPARRPAEPEAEARIVPRETITLVWASDWNSPLAHPRTPCVRTRRAAAFPARAPVVCRQGARPARRQARIHHSAGARRHQRAH